MSQRRSSSSSMSRHEEDEENENPLDMSYSSSIISNISNLLGNTSSFLTNAREFAEKEVPREERLGSRGAGSETKFSLRDLIDSMPKNNMRRSGGRDLNTSSSSITSASGLNSSRKTPKISLPSILERSNEDSKSSGKSFYLSPPDASILSPNSTVSVPDLDSMIERALDNSHLRRSNSTRKDDSTFCKTKDSIEELIAKSNSSRSSSSSRATPDSWSKFDAHLNQSLAQANAHEIAFGFDDAENLSVSDSEFKNLTPKQIKEFLNQDRQEQLYLVNPVAQSFSKSRSSPTFNQSKVLSPLNEKEISMGKYFIKKSDRPWETLRHESDLDETIKSETLPNEKTPQQSRPNRISLDSAIVSAQTSLRNRFSLSHLDESGLDASMFRNNLEKGKNRGSTPMKDKIMLPRKTSSSSHAQNGDPPSFVSAISRKISSTFSSNGTRTTAVNVKAQRDSSTNTSLVNAPSQSQGPPPAQQFQQIQPQMPSYSNANSNFPQYPQNFQQQGLPQVVQGSAYNMNPSNAQAPFYGLPIIIQIQCPVMQAAQQNNGQPHPNFNYPNPN